jgi:hypothetical protein
VDFGRPSASAAPVKLLVSATFVNTTMSLRSMTVPCHHIHSVVSRFHELTGKVDRFFARALARHGDDMLCASGCSDCCHVRLSVLAVEADAIRDELARWSAERRAELAAHAAAAPADRCAALDTGGRCAIYAARPLVCRSHGAPIRVADGGDDDGADASAPPLSTSRKRLPVIHSCFRNFTRGAPDADCVLDQTTLSTLALAVDRDHGSDGRRFDLAELLASSAPGG